jgi:aspartate dehydrogenase
MTVRVGLVGLGTIGQEVARRLLAGSVAGIELTAIATRSTARANEWIRRAGCDVPVVQVSECASMVDVLVEAASSDAVPMLIQLADQHKLRLAILSGCALIREPNLLERARLLPVPGVLPSAAIFGMDGVIAAREGSIARAELVIRRPLQGIEQTPYMRAFVRKHGEIQGETLVFQGTPLGACEAFPGRTNIGSTFALAGAGVDRTAVWILANPNRETHSHEVRVEGLHGTMNASLEFSSTPMRGVDSIITLSVLAWLRSLSSRDIRIGS